MRFHLLFIIFFISSCNFDNKSDKLVIDNTKESNLKFPVEVGDVKYTGPGKINYILESKRHGGIDLSVPSEFGVYPSDIYEKALNEMYNIRSLSFAKPTISSTNEDENSNYAETSAIFKSRGPSNTPGRVLTTLVDSRDITNSTWIVGTVGGGLWKTENSGVNYEQISSDLQNSYISSIVQSKSNAEILYMGTGNAWHFEEAGQFGGGVYRSDDGGVTWDNISLLDSIGNIDPKFRSISSVVVDNLNSDIITIAAWPGSYYIDSDGPGFIYRSEDAGVSWNLVYISRPLERITQLIPSPSNNNIIYASVSKNGVLKSTDGGLSWNNPGNIGLIGDISYDHSDGIYKPSITSNFGRVSVSVSHSDPNTLYLAAVNEFPANGFTGTPFSKLFRSNNGGVSWNLIKNDDGSDDDWLNALGYFANSIMVHPFNDSIVYHASQDMQRSKILPGEGARYSGSSTVVEIDNISRNIKIQNIWGGSAVGTGSDWFDHSYNPEFDNFEILFGTGISQKAYRFSVPENSSSNVGHQFYTYQDVVDVPFQVWNTSANPPQQITISFRDNNNDGEFNLQDNSNESREYIFTQNIPYDQTMSQADIKSLYGQLYKTTYLIWLYLSEGTEWNENNLPNSSIKIRNIDMSYTNYKKDLVDITNWYTGNTINQNVHVDHHFFYPILSNSDSMFSFILGSDGGLNLSKIKKNPGIDDDDFFLAGEVTDSWFDTPHGGLNTSLLWGADKVIGKEQYLIGAQDHGSFLSHKDFNASDTSKYTFTWGGDGFEVLTHFTDPNKMLAGSQFNNAIRSLDGGETWSYVSNIPGYRSLDAPFSSQYASSYQDPDVIFSMYSTGLGKSSDWGENWKTVQVPDGNWELLNNRDIKVSDANPRFVWTGGYMGNLSNIYVSDDWGDSFNSVNNFTNSNGQSMGTISGIYTHPNEDSTAYVLFSYYGYPKIIKTTDLGQTWIDISGFGSLDEGISVSSTGFPNVGVYSLLVMPHNNDIIWVGTDIGLIETTDGGLSWHIVPNMPHVAIYDMKIKDQGHVILTTHGRGLWTATLDDLMDFTPKVATVPPRINNAIQIEDEILYIIEAEIQLKSIYDSIQIVVNDKIWKSITDSISISIINTRFNVDSKGNKYIKAIGYKNGLPYPSNEFQLYLNPTLEPRSEFSTTFSDLVGDEFALDRFKIGPQGGFVGRQLHTEHPYESGVAGGYTNGYSVHAQLNIPIIVNDFTPSIRFKEIVLVEPGEPGTSYGDWNFWDYVIIEASKDGVSWKKLVDGYDSDSDPSWKAAYNSGSVGTPDLLRDRQINFSPHFAIGDTLKVRFRLFSDDLTVSWGWLIDDLYIQKETPVVQGLEFSSLDKEISIFPNPTSGEFYIKFDQTWQGYINCNITDIFGRNIYENVLDNTSSNSSHQINITDSNDGLYFVQLVQGDKKTMKKIIKE